MKRFAICIFAVVMLCVMVPLAAMSVFAADNITEYDCLEVGAGAYIITDIVPTSDTRIVMEAELNNKAVALFGVDLAVNNDTTYNFHVNTGGDSEYGPSGFGYGYGAKETWVNATVKSGRQKIDLNKNKFVLDEKEIHSLDSGTDFSFNNYTLYLFGIHEVNPGTADYPQTFEGQFVRFYSCKVYKGNDLVRELVPAKKKNYLGVEEVGVYDRKSGNFYGKQGNGSMNAGVSCLVYENGSFVTKAFDAERLISNADICNADVYYAAAGETVFKNRVEFTGERSIILCDGAKLVFENGIQLENGGTLNIYAQSQSENMGKLTVYGYGGNAAIGGNRGTDYAENPVDRDGKYGGNVNIHGGNIDVYSESVGFGGGDGGIGKASPEGPNAGDGSKGGDGGDAMGGSIYGGNVVLHTGRALFGAGNGGKGGLGRSYTEKISDEKNARFAGNGGDGGSVSSVKLYGGNAELPDSAVFVCAGKGGDGGDGELFIAPNYLKEVYITNNPSSYTASFGGNGGNGGDVREVRFCGNCNIIGGNACILGGDGGKGGNGADIGEKDGNINEGDGDYNAYSLNAGRAGKGGNGGNAAAAICGGDGKVSYGDVFLGGGYRGECGEWGVQFGEVSRDVKVDIYDSLDESASSGLCELNIHAGKLTLSSTSGTLMRNGSVNYYGYAVAKLGGTPNSLGKAGIYDAGQFWSNSCAVLYDFFIEETGTSDDPYLISNSEQLSVLADIFAKNKDISVKNFKLSQDITYSGQPIGSAGHPFNGVFDGDGHKLTLDIKTGNTGAALFYETDGAVIKNLEIAGSVSGKDCVGGVVGHAYGNTLIDNCHVTASVTGTEVNIGGVVGMLFDSTVSNCRVDAKVTGGWTNVGGIVGWLHNNSKVVNCVKTGETIGCDAPIYGDESVGGIVGGASEGDSVIANCASIGKITAYNNGGGIIGSIEDNVRTFRLYCCYSNNEMKVQRAWGTICGNNHNNRDDASFNEKVEGTDILTVFAEQFYHHDAKREKVFQGNHFPASTAVKAANRMEIVNTINTYLEKHGDIVPGVELSMWSEVGEDILPNSCKGFTVSSYGTGSILSEGSVWIIIAVAAVVLGGVAALVVVTKKKKPATAGGAETENKE